MLGMMVISVNTLRELLIEYIARPVDVVTKLERETDLTFPAVTLCNINPMRNSKLSQSSLLTEALSDNVISRVKRGNGNSDIGNIW